MFFLTVLLLACALGLAYGAINLIPALILPLFAPERGEIIAREKRTILAMSGIILAALLGVGAICNASNGLTISRCREIAENPKAWLAEEIQDSRRLRGLRGIGKDSVTRALVIVDREISSLAAFRDDIGDAADKNTVNRAIGALSRERECLVGLLASSGRR